jgi:hypothetical protein
MTDIFVARQRLMRVLRRRKIALVDIDYDGEGDNGQIEGIAAADARGQAVALDAPVRIALRGDPKPARYASLHEALDDFAWMLLQHFHEGFENEDGGYGTIVIDVAKDRIELQHNARVSDVLSSTTEV